MPQAIARTVATLDPRIQRVTVEPLALIVERNLEGRSTAIRLVGGFGLLALLLTGIGIFGIVSFRAAERSRELAIRSALGATAGQLRRLVLAHAAGLAIGGGAAGLAGFGCVLPLLRGRLYGIGAIDPPSIAGVMLGVGVVALLASLGPSRRAAKRAPMELLRNL
jgi:ABC-type antimicrobial peptide transport system permease subunit